MKTKLLKKLRRGIWLWYLMSESALSLRDVVWAARIPYDPKTMMRIETELRRIGRFDGFWDTFPFSQPRGCRLRRLLRRILSAIEAAQVWLEAHGVGINSAAGKALDSVYWRVFMFGRLNWNRFTKKYERYSRKYWLPDAVLRRAVKEGV